METNYLKYLILRAEVHIGHSLLEQEVRLCSEIKLIYPGICHPLARRHDGTLTINCPWGHYVFTIIILILSFYVIVLLLKSTIINKLSVKGRIELYVRLLRLPNRNETNRTCVSSVKVQKLPVFAVAVAQGKHAGRLRLKGEWILSIISTF